MCNPWCQTFATNTLPLWPNRAEVLEVGARNVNGSVREQFAPHAARYVGADLEAGPGVDVVADVTRLSSVFPASSFDVVVTTEMMEHVPDWPAAWAEMMTVLRPGGLLIVTTRSPGFPRHDYPGDFWRFTPEDVRAILAGAGEILMLENDDTLEYACGIGVVARKERKLDTVAWRARLSQEVALYNVVLCTSLTHAAFVAHPEADSATATHCRRIAELEQQLFEAQIRSLERRAETVRLATQLASQPDAAAALQADLPQTTRILAEQLAQRDESLQQAATHIQKLEFSLAAWRASVFGRLSVVADRGYELARLPVRAARYLANRTLLNKAVNNLQRRWLRHRPFHSIGLDELPHLATVLQKLELPVTAEQVAAHLGPWMTRRDVNNFRRYSGLLVQAMARPDQPRVLRATELPVPAAAKQRRLRILFVCGEFPNPVHGGGSRVADFIKVLGERHEVFVAAWYDRRRDHDAYVALAPYARVLRGLPFEDLEGGCVEKMLQMLDHQPADVVHYEWPRSLQSFDRRLGRHHIYTHMEVVSHSLWLDLKRLAPLSPEWCQRMSQLLTILGVETLDAARADLQIAVTGKDGQFLSRFRPDLPFYVVNHGINLDDFVLPERTPEPNTVVFTGNFAHYPNQDAVHFFMRDIHPVVRAAVPELRVLLVGANPPPDIRAYHDGRRIIVTGHVPDVRPYIQQAAVCMAPLISGAGLRTKVVQYAALRRPSVITPIAAADLDFEPGREVLLTADPREFARQLSELLLHPTQAMELARAARVKALALYDNRKIAEVGLGNLYQHLLSTEERS